MILGLVLAAAAPAAEAPLIPAFLTGERLYRICSRPNAGQCSMYVAGVLDGVFLTRSSLGGEPLCPEKMNNREAAELVTSFLEHNPDIRPHAAAVGIRQALAEKLECGRDGPAEPQVASAR